MSNQHIFNNQCSCKIIFCIYNLNRTSLKTNGKEEVIQDIYKLEHLYLMMKIDTRDMISEMESYRGKISSDIDNVIDWQL